MSEPILNVSDLCFSYGQMQILFDVALDVAPGEALALLGTNGAGKSTLLSAISGLGKPTAGRVMFDGRDITGKPAERLVDAGLALVQGGRSVFPDMTVEENLDIQLYSTRRKLGGKQRRQLALQTFPRLAERKKQRAGTLSGGEQQQLALARAVMLEPKLLCIDELSLGLAPIIVEELLDIVRGIHAQGTAVLLVEQSLNIAASLCERAIFMEKGTVRFEGRTTDLLDNDDIARAVFLGAKHPATQDL
jgi:ABC-type branched-subunit amino acid transport system ATPase component